MDKNSVDLLLNKSRILKGIEGESLFTPNDKCNSVGVILEGKLSFYHHTSQGKEVLIREMGESDIFGELICFQGKNYPNWISCKTQSIVALIPGETLLKLLKNETFFISFMSLIGTKSKNLLDKIDVLSLKKVEERIAYYRLNIGEYNSISSLATYIGCSREATSRALTNLRGKIDLNSREDLEEILY